MNKFSFFLLLFIALFLNFSCKKIDITPAYLVLTVEDFQDCIDVSKFNTDNFDNLDNLEEKLNIIKQQDFKDVLVTLNGTQIGYWNLPCRIPLLPDYSRQNNIEVIPCVRVANVTLTTVPYYFLKPVEKFFDLEKEGEYKFSDLFSNFKFEYAPSVAFPMVETFVQGTSFKSLDSIHGANMDIFRENEESIGRILLTDTLLYFNIATSYLDLNAQVGGQRIRQFWEIHYKCDGEMVTYLDFRTLIYPQDMVVLPPTKGVWKTAYIDLTEEIAWAAGAASRVSVRLGIRGNRISNAKNAYFYFGNIKLITMHAPY